MDNLVFNCTDALLQPDIPLCATDYGERVTQFVVMKKGGTFTVAGSDNPTAAEFQTAITAGQLALYNGISNGHRIEGNATELSGDDTITGGTERYDVNNICEGRLKLIDESVSRGTEKLDRYSQLRLWIFTDKNYVFGGKTGYLASPIFGTKVFEGKGQPPYIPFKFEWIVTGADNAKYDADFSTLTT
jgi:hypothetical protein